MQLPIDPHVRDLAFLVGDLPVVAGAAVHLFDSDILASCTWIGGARIAGIGERFDVRPALAPASRHVTCTMLHLPGGSRRAMALGAGWLFRTKGARIVDSVSALGLYS